MLHVYADDPEKKQFSWTRGSRSASYDRQWVLMDGLHGIKSGDGAAIQLAGMAPAHPPMGLSSANRVSR